MVFIENTGTPLSTIGSLSRLSYSQERWYTNKHAKNTLVTAASAFYGFLLTISSLVYEMFNLYGNNEVLADVIFPSFMFGVSTLFFLYCYCDLYAIATQFRTYTVKQKIGIMLRLVDSGDEPKIITHIQGVSRIPRVLLKILTNGSLILKIGFIVFALFCLVDTCYWIYYHFNIEPSIYAIKYILCIIFISIQTHFIFCNWEIKHTSSYIIGRFGTMHLVAANLWHFFRFIFFIYDRNSILSNVFSTTSKIPGHTSTSALEIQTTLSLLIQNSSVTCYGIECNPTVLNLTLTSLFSYSIISATIMFIVWDKMKYIDHRKICRDYKEHRKINFNNISYGILLGLMLVASTIVVLVKRPSFKADEKLTAAMTYYAAEVAQYIITILACLFALYVMRVLSLVDTPQEKKDEEERKDLLDIIMLTIGLIGEMFYSVGCLFGVISTNQWDILAAMITLSHALRLLQVSLQFVLIYISRKLRSEDDAAIAKQPGKHAISFLFIANISMMVTRYYELENFGVSHIVAKFYGNNLWGFIVGSFLPLTFFYRFHSSVCLADIWTNTYSEKIDEPGVKTTIKNSSSSQKCGFLVSKMWLLIECIFFKKVFIENTAIIPNSPHSKIGSLSKLSYSQERWYISKHAKNTLVTTASAFYGFLMTIFSLVYERYMKTSLSYSQERWYTSKHAKNTLVTTASAFYALILIIFFVLYELFGLVGPNGNGDLAEMIVVSYMFGVSILFLLYCYYDLYMQFRTYTVKQKIGIMLRLEDLKDEPKIITHIQGVSCISSVLQEILTTGDLILKIGCIVFALFGLADYAVEIYLCFRTDECAKYTTIRFFIAIIFIVIQTHFILCNWKIKHTSSYIISRFGTMHLVATNLWTWVRFIFSELGMMSTNLSHAFSNDSTSHENMNTSTSESNTINETLVGFMYTGLVEYSLIGAIVMLIVWDNMKYIDHPKICRDYKEHRKINFNNISYGILLGLVFLASTIVVLVMYEDLNGKDEELAAAITFGATNLAQSIITSFACLFALYAMRVLSFVDIPQEEKDKEEERKEQLDIILLSIGLIGEIIYSGGGLIGLISANNWDKLSVIITLSHAFRLVQVSLQSVLIYISRKLRVEDEANISKHPGKHTITFLFIANILMMIMNLHESENFGVSPIVVQFYEMDSYIFLFLVRVFAPLTIFYRFHSSICLSDIWINTYSEKVDEPGVNSIKN